MVGGIESLSEREMREQRRGDERETDIAPSNVRWG